MKKQTVKCPVCDSDIVLDCDYLDHTLMSETSVCGKCCMYAYHYDTGSYQQSIKIKGAWQDWFWGYGEEGKEMKSRQQQLDIAIRYAKLEYQEASNE